MKRTAFLLCIILTLWACKQKPANSETNSTTGTKPDTNKVVGKPSKPDTSAKTKTIAPAAAATSIDVMNLFTEADAEKILGQKVKIKESGMRNIDGVIAYSCVYQAKQGDAKSGKVGVVNVTVEDYHSQVAAASKYASLKNADQPAGIKILHDMGDEAYYQNDGENFYYVCARKGAKMAKIKAIKIPGLTSFEQFKRISKRIADTM